MPSPSRLPARVLVRTDVDYASMTASTFAAQEDPTRPLLFIRFATNARCLETFERVFGYGFFRLRAELRASAEDGLSLMRGVRKSVGFADFDAWFDDPEDELVFPIDDDDVFHPDLAARATLPADAAMVVWGWRALGVHPWGVQPALHHADGPILLSNNWGVRKSFLRSALSKDDARRFLADHATAQEAMVHHLGLASKTGWDGMFANAFTELRHPSVHFIEGAHSLQLLHPASLYLLALAAQTGDLETHLRALDVAHAVPLPAELGWAAPAVARYESLVLRLAEGRSARATENATPGHGG
jgi:hypothetical protein